MTTLTGDQMIRKARTLERRRLYLRAANMLRGAAEYFLNPENEGPGVEWLPFPADDWTPEMIRRKRIVRILSEASYLESKATR